MTIFGHFSGLDPIFAEYSTVPVEISDGQNIKNGIFKKKADDFFTVNQHFWMKTRKYSSILVELQKTALFCNSKGQIWPYFSDFCLFFAVFPRKMYFIGTQHSETTQSYVGHYFTTFTNSTTVTFSKWNVDFAFWQLWKKAIFFVSDSNFKRLYINCFWLDRKIINT